MAFPSQISQDLSCYSSLEEAASGAMRQRVEAMKRLVTRFLTDEGGASAIEYGLVAALVSVAIIGVLLSVGVNLSIKLQDISDAIARAGI